MKLILACDPVGGIGYKNRLPWETIQGDLPRFKRLTAGNSVVMGRTTWDSLPKKPLPNRINYVFTTRPHDELLAGAIAFTDQDFLKSIPTAWVIGGSKMIDIAWPLIDEIHLTKTFIQYDCDTHFNLVKLMREFVSTVTEKYPDHTYTIWKRR